MSWKATAGRGILGRARMPTEAHRDERAQSVTQTANSLALLKLGVRQGWEWVPIRLEKPAGAIPQLCMAAKVEVARIGDEEPLKESH